MRKTINMVLSIGVSFAAVVARKHDRRRRLNRSRRAVALSLPLPRERAPWRRDELIADRTVVVEGAQRAVHRIGEQTGRCMGKEHTDVADGAGIAREVEASLRER